VRGPDADRVWMQPPVDAVHVAPEQYPGGAAAARRWSIFACYSARAVEAGNGTARGKP